MDICGQRTTGLATGKKKAPALCSAPGQALFVQKECGVIVSYLSSIFNTIHASMRNTQHKQPRGRVEEAEQAALVKWSHKPSVREVLPALRWLHHSPNGGQRNSFTGAQMKALGVKPGFPDLVLPVTRGTHVGLVIEMKSEKGVLSPMQKEWLEHFVAQGWAVFVVRSAEHARGLLCEYLGVDVEQAPPLDAA